MRSSELVFFHGGFLFDRCIFLCCTISGFPLCKRDMPDIKFLLILIGAGCLSVLIMAFIRDDGKRRVGGRVVGPLGFGLGILECVDVLGDYLAFEMVTLHLVLQCEDNEVMNPTTRHLEVDEKLPHGNQGVVGLGPIDFADPRVFDSAEDEFTRFMLCGFISGEVEDAVLVNGSLTCSHRRFIVVPDRRIMGDRFWGAGEHGGVIFCVRCRVLNDPDEVMDAFFLVIRNDKEDSGEYLMKFCNM